jgi:hypothetical protein
MPMVLPVMMLFRTRAVPRAYTPKPLMITVELSTLIGLEAISANPIEPFPAARLRVTVTTEPSLR